jgi:hypothetical protein
MGMQGETNPTTTEEEIESLSQWIRESNLPLTSAKDRVNAIKLGLKARELPKRHLRHAVSIAENVFARSSALVDLTGDLMLKFSRYFRFLEHTWNHSESIKSRRVYFLNYKFLIEKMCEKWKVGDYHVVAIKSKTLRRKQEQYYADIVKAAHDFRGQVKNKNILYEF